MTSTMRERFYIWYDQKNNSSSPEYPITTGELTDFIEREIRKEREEIINEIENETIIVSQHSFPMTFQEKQFVGLVPMEKIINTIKNRK